MAGVGRRRSGGGLVPIERTWCRCCRGARAAGHAGVQPEGATALAVSRPLAAQRETGSRGDEARRSGASRAGALQQGDEEA